MSGVQTMQTGMTARARTFARWGSALLLAPLLQLGAAASASAQAPGGAPPGPATPKEAAQIDITGQWVSVVSEDWIYRMVTAPQGDVGSIPVNDAGKKAAAEWDPVADAASCKAYGAAGIMRMPGRLRISWRDDRTLELQFDAGSQTRLLHFEDALPPLGYSSSEPPAQFSSPDDPGAPKLSGYSIAAWHKQGQSRGLGFGGPPIRSGQHGSLAALTTNMAPGYLQSNGVPYSANAVLKEFFNLITLPDQTQWLVVTSIVEDPQYLSTPFVTSTQFKRETGDEAAEKWRPTSCT